MSASAGGGSDAGGDVSGSASADASGSTSADLALDDPLLDVIVLINGSVWTDSSFSGVAGIDATTYDVGAWINSDNSAAFQSTLEANAGDIAELQAAIDANAEFSAWLDAENADVSSVVAVGVASDGSLAVFTHD